MEDHKRIILPDGEPLSHFFTTHKKRKKVADSWDRAMDHLQQLCSPEADTASLEAEQGSKPLPPKSRNARRRAGKRAKLAQAN